MTKKKKSRLTRFVSYLYKHKYLDDSCFAEEVEEDEYLKGGEDMDGTERRKQINQLATDAAATVFVVGSCIAAFTIACSVTYYSIKGTVGLFKTVGQIGSKIVNR